MLFKELKQSLINEVSPIYLTTGEDDFLCVSSENLIEKQLFNKIDKNNLNKQVFSSDEVDINELKKSLDTLPFFADKKMIVLKEYEGKTSKELMQLLKDYAKNVNSSAVLLIHTAKESEILSALKNDATIIDCSKLDKSMLQKWILNKVNSSKKISADAIDLLIDYTNGYLSKISIELDKLLAYSKEEILADDIKAIVHKDLEYSIFELTDSIINSNILKAQQIKNDLMNNKKLLPTILPLIISYFRRLFYSIITDGSDAEIASSLNVKEYAIKKSKLIAKKFGAKKLKEIISLCEDLDYKTKTSKISLENATELILAKIMTA